MFRTAAVAFATSLALSCSGTVGGGDAGKLDAASPSDAGPGQPDAAVQLCGPGQTIDCCGDGEADRTYDPDLGWFVEECDEGDQNGTGSSPCGTDCRYRRCSQGRVCGPIRSSFGAYFPWEDEAIARLFLSMKDMGYEEFIPVNIGAQLWDLDSPTGVENGYYDDASGPSVLQRHMAIAERARMRIIVGLSGIIVDGGYGWQIWHDPALRPDFVNHDLDVAAEVMSQVGSSAAFGGFYIAQEANLGQTNACTISDLYEELIAGAGGRPGLRELAGPTRIISIAPYLAVGQTAPATIGSRLRCIYDKLDVAGGIDRIMVQDGVPKGDAGEGFTTLNNVGSHFVAMRNALPAGAAREVLWTDLETYAWPDSPCTSGPGGSRPATIGRIGDQVREIGAYVGGFSQWLHQHNFTDSARGDGCDDSRAQLGAAYVARPFPFSAFVFENSIIVRGYRFEQSGTLHVVCGTGSGTQALDYTSANGLQVIYAPNWLAASDAPDPTEVFEVYAPVGACESNIEVTFVSSDGVASSVVSL